MDIASLSASYSSCDVAEQQKRVEFMEHLYQLYKPESHHYTGLWEKYKQAVAVSLREDILAEPALLLEYVKPPAGKAPVH